MQKKVIRRIVCRVLINNSPVIDPLFFLPHTKEHVERVGVRDTVHITEIKETDNLWLKPRTKLSKVYKAFKAYY